MKNKIRILRPVNLGIIAATMLVICFKYRNDLAENFYLNLVLLIVPAVLTAAAGYVVNDIYDIRTDKLNRPDKVVVGTAISVRQAWFLYGSLSILSLGLSYLFSLQYAIVNLCISFILYLYSLSLKGLPLIGNLVVALCSSAVIVCCFLDPELVYIKTAAGWWNFVLYLIFVFFITVIRELVKDMQDMEGDAAAGLKTYPIIAGIKGAKIIVYILTGIEIIFCGLYSFLAFLAFFSADMYISSVIMGLIAISLFYFINRLSRAKTSQEFGKCSILLKYIMFAGVINLIFS